MSSLLFEYNTNNPGDLGDKSVNAVRLSGQVNEDRQLTVQLPESVPPGPVIVLIMPICENEDVAGDSWEAGVAREWAEELDDPRQDIYTLTDGSPVDDAP